MEGEASAAASMDPSPPSPSETLVSGPALDPAAAGGGVEQSEHRGGGESSPSFDQADILKALEIVERDSTAIAQSYTSLFDSLRVALSEVTSSSVDHMQVFGDAAGRLQESALDAATKGNRYINSCLRLNEEIKGIDSLAAQLKLLRRNVDALDSAVNKILRLP